MPLRIWCRRIVDGALSETVLPGTHPVGAAPSSLRRLLNDVTAAQPGWSIKGPFHEDGKFARWEVVDNRGAVTAAYRLVGPREWPNYGITEPGLPSFDTPARPGARRLADRQ